MARSSYSSLFELLKEIWESKKDPRSGGPKVCLFKADLILRYAIIASFNGIITSYFHEYGVGMTRNKM